MTRDISSETAKTKSTFSAAFWDDKCSDKCWSRLWSKWLKTARKRGIKVPQKQKQKQKRKHWIHLKIFPFNILSQLYQRHHPEVVSHWISLSLLANNCFSLPNLNDDVFYENIEIIYFVFVFFSILVFLIRLYLLLCLFLWPSKICSERAWVSAKEFVPWRISSLIISFGGHLTKCFQIVCNWCFWFSIFDFTAFPFIQEKNTDKRMLS